MSELISERNNLDLPPNWILVKIEDIGEIVTGNTPSKKNSAFYGKEYAFFKPTDLNAGYYVKTATDGLSTAGVKYARPIPEKSIMVTCIGATIGKTGFNRITGVTNQQINSIIPNLEIVFPEYLYFLFTSIKIQKNIIQNASSTTLPILNKSKFSKILIPIPPIQEQKRIVSKIEELLSKIDFSKQVLEKTKILLKQHRQSFLKSAFEGKLTEKWRKENNLDMHSEKKSLENLILFSKNGFTGKPNEAKKGIPRLGIETITRTNSIHVDETKHKFIEIPTSEMERYRAKKGDLFVCRQNGNKNYVGKSAVFNDLIKPMIFSDSLIQLRPKTELIVPEYLAFFINSQQGRKQIEKFCSTTAGNYSINGTNLKKTIIAFPLLLEQKQIMVKIEERLSLIENDEKIIDLSLKNIDIMRKSILKQAFEGKLVPQDLTDETAEILSKIKQEKEKLQENQKIIKDKTIKIRKMKNAK